MAEIKIHRRQQSPWPWIIAIIILAGFIWIIFMYVYMPIPNQKEDSTYSGMRYKEPFDSTNEVSEFIVFSRDTSKPVNIKRYTEEGLLKLQSALSYLADRINPTNAGIKKSIDTLDSTVAKADTASRNYLSELKPAFSSVIKTMDSIQKLKYPELTNNISNLRNTEININDRASVSSQINKIRQFFSDAGNTLQQMKLSYGYIDTKGGF